MCGGDEIRTSGEERLWQLFVEYSSQAITFTSRIHLSKAIRVDGICALGDDD